MTGGSPSTENGNLIQQKGHESAAADGGYVSGIGVDRTATAGQASSVGGGEDGRSFGASGRSVRRSSGRGRAGSDAGGRAVGINDEESQHSSDSEYAASEGWDSDLDAPLASPRSTASNTSNSEPRQSLSCRRDKKVAGRSATAYQMQASRCSSWQSSETFSSASSSAPNLSNSAHVNNYDSESELGEPAMFFKEKSDAIVWRRDPRPAPTHSAIQPRTDSHEELSVANTITCSQGRRPSLSPTPLATATPLIAAAAAPCRTTFFGTTSCGRMTSQATSSATPTRMHDRLSIPTPDARLLHSAHLPVPSTATATITDVGGTACVHARRARIVAAAQGPSTAGQSLDRTSRGLVADSGTGSHQNDPHGLFVYADHPHDASQGSWRTASMYNGSPAADILPRLRQVGDDDHGKGKAIKAESLKLCSKSPVHNAVMSAAPPPSLIPYDEYESGVQWGGGHVAALIDCESVSSADDAMSEGGDAAVFIDGNREQAKRKFQDDSVGKSTGLTTSDDRPNRLFKRQHAWKGLANEEDQASAVQMFSGLPSWAERTSTVGVGGAGLAEIMQDCNSMNDGSSNSNNTNGVCGMTRTTATTTEDVASAFSAWKEQDALGDVMVQVLPSSASTNAMFPAFPHRSSPPLQAPPHSLTWITDNPFNEGPLPAQLPPALSGAIAHTLLVPPAQETMMMPTAVTVAPSTSSGFDSYAPAAQISAGQRVARANLDGSISPASLTGAVVAGTELWEEFEDLECATMASMATRLTREESLLRAFEAVGAEFNMTPSSCEASAFAAIW